ncbi:MAG: type II secretion system protein GspD [Gemmatimonadetes bacterium]|nr:type II secretion system protein GspD [Gemmatimonadota bacterium]
MRRIHQFTCSVFLLLSIVCAVDAEVRFVASQTSLGRAKSLLDQIDLRVMLPLGFERAPSMEASATLSRRPGVQEGRVYGHADQAPIEVAIVNGPTGYDIALSRASELGSIATQISTLVRSTTQAASRAPVDKGYEMLRLGHIEADRALALLKALGYNTIEFNAKSQGSDQIFDVVRSSKTALPWIVRVSSASKTSLMQAQAGARATATRSTSSGSKGGLVGAPQLGGSHLHSATEGSPQERLMIVYDKSKPEELEQIVNLLQTHIDVAAQQIVIEALVIEVNTNSVDDLGLEFSGSTGSVSGAFQREGTLGPRQGTFIFSRDTFTDFGAFSASLEALQESGDAEILSSPSVLVLNDRQARIQVGRQIPVSRTTATTSAVTKGVEYFPIGIVLNLRPRIDRERSEVTMQIETIISSISPESAAKLEQSSGDITFSPIVDNRQVETYVRVADGTPFIIGGLLSTDEQQTRISLPFVSELPFIGRLFSRERLEREHREVIVVLTPHIVPQDARSFSYLIPKDSDIFDRFDYTLFRNAYRVRDAEVWDLRFIQASPVLRGIVDRIRQHGQQDVTMLRQEPFASFLAGRIPGEEVLVRTMLTDIIRNLDYGAEVDLEKVFFFEATEGHNLVDRGFNDALGTTLQDAGQAILLGYKAAAEVHDDGSYFTYPFATISQEAIPADEQDRVDFLRSVNPVDDDGQPQEWTIALATEEDVNHLRNVLILKRILDLNNKLPLTLEAFQPGLQILFPSREDMANRYHLIDSDVAQYFYETSSSQYYPAFERVFNRKVHEVEQNLRGAR